MQVTGAQLNFQPPSIKWKRDKSIKTIAYKFITATDYLIIFDSPLFACDFQPADFSVDVMSRVAWRHVSGITDILMKYSSAKIRYACIHLVSL